MYKASEILSKPVIDIQNGKTLGTTKNLCFNENITKLEQIILFNDEDEIDELAFSPHSIYKVGRDAIMLKDDSEVRPLVFERFNLKLNNPINSRAYNLEGEFLGHITDVELNKNFTAAAFFQKDTRFDVHKIACISSNTLLVNTTNKKIAKRKFKIPLNLSKTQKVTVLPEPIIVHDYEPAAPATPTPPQIETVVTETKKPYKISPSPTPERILTNDSFLLGRKATKTIYGQNNEIIVRKEAIISEKILKFAKLHGKLVEIAVYTSPNIKQKREA